MYNLFVGPMSYQNSLSNMYIYDSLHRYIDTFRGKGSIVKPVYNGHPWNPQKVANVQMVAVVQKMVQNSR
jgi:hypothetical protein